MAKKTYDNSMINSFPDKFKMELPDGYRIDIDYDEDGEQTATLRGGFSFNDEGEETAEFSAAFITMNSTIENRENMIKEGKLKDHFVPGMMLEQLAESAMENLQEQFGTGTRLNLYDSYPASLIMKFYKPFSIFGVTLESYVVMYLVEVTENLFFGFNTVYQNNEDGNEVFYKHLLNVIKSVRVSGKSVNTGKLTPKKLEAALDMKPGEDVEALDLGVSIGINFQHGDEETQYTLNSDGSISEEKVNTGLEYTSPKEELYPHYNSMLRSQGLGMLGMLGVNVVVNQTGTEYKFYNLEDDLDEEASDEMKNAVSQLNDTGASKYTLADRAKEMMSVFHVSPEVFDTAHDRECELQEGMMHRAYMMSALRSFAWTMAKYCDALNKKPADLSLEQIQNIIDTIADANWLNYDNKSVCKGLCGTQDLHVYYLPDKTPESVKAVFKPSPEVIEQTKQMQEKFPNYNPILSQIGSLDELRKDLEYIHPAIEKIYEDLKANRNYNEALLGNDADILYAWCALSYAARGPFFSEDGPTMNFFSQLENDEEKHLRLEKMRKENEQKYINEFGDFFEKDPNIEFAERKFVLAGFWLPEKLLDNEPDYRSLIEERGGLIRTKVSGVTDYLVVEPAGFAESEINRAIEQQKNDKPVKIIRVDDLRQALGLHDHESETANDVSPDKPIQVPLSDEKAAQVIEETVIVDDSWAVLVPDGFKYCTDKNIIGNHRNIIIMEDKPDNDFEDPFGASISFTSMFNESENENMDGIAMAKMMVSFMGVKNNEVVKDDHDLYVSYYYEPNRSYKEAGEKLDVHHITVGTAKGVSSIQVFFSNSPLLRREQTKLVEKVAKSIRLRLPGEKNSKITTTAKKSVPKESSTASTKAVPFAKRERNIGQWGFKVAEIPANRKKLIDNIYGYPIRFLPYSKTQKSWEHDMAFFKFYCYKRLPEFFEQVKTVTEHAEKYANFFDDETASDIRSGKLNGSAPIHALRSFIWTATEIQGNKVKNSFPSDAPAEMWLDLAQFIANRENANYSSVGKNIKRFGAALLRKEEVRSIYCDGIGFSNPQWRYKDESLGKTMNNASISSLFQVVETLLQIIPVMDAYCELLNGDGVDERTIDTIRLILQGWLAYAFACRQPFFIVPGEHCKEELDSADIPNWAISPVISETEDGRFTLSDNEIIKIKDTSYVLVIPEGVKGILLQEDIVSELANSFKYANKIIYPYSFEAPIVIPANIKEIVISSDLEIFLTNTIPTTSEVMLESLMFTGKPKAIGPYAFDKLVNLKSIEVPEGTERLYTSSFYGCTPRTIKLPESLKQVDEEVFVQYKIDTNVVISTYKDCSAIGEIKRQLKQHKDYWAELNRKYPLSTTNKTYNIKLNEMDSPWLTRAKSFVNKISWLYDKKDTSQISDNTVREILTDTIGDFVNFAKCRDYLITESLAKGLGTLNEIISSSSNNQQVYFSLPEKLSADIRQSIEKRNREEKERKLNEIKTLSQSDDITDLSRAITMLEEFSGESTNAEALINRCTEKINTIKAGKYAEAVSLAKKQTTESIKAAIDLMCSISPYEDSGSKITEWHKLAETESQYVKAVDAMYKSNIDSLINTKAMFEKLGGYKDSATKAAACEKRAEELRENMYLEARNAEKTYSLKSQTEALSLYRKLGDYKDSADRKKTCDEKCEIIRDIHSLNKEIETHKSELSALKGAFKGKERKAKEAEISTKEQRVAELKDKLTGQYKNQEEKAAEEEKLAEIDVTASANAAQAPAENNTIPEAAKRSGTVTASATPKKKSKAGVIIAILIILALLAVGFVKIALPMIVINQYDDSYEEEEEVVQEKTPEFEAANVLSFEEVSRDITEYDTGEEITYLYKVKNNSDKAIWGFESDVHFYDANGKDLCNSWSTYRGNLEPGKWAYMEATSSLEGKGIDSVGDIGVKSYSYNIENQSSTVGLKTNYYDIYSGVLDDMGNTDFNSANILDVEIEDGLHVENGQYITSATVTNNGKEKLKDVTVGVEFFDEEGNSIERAYCGVERGPDPEKSLKIEVYCSSDYADQVKSIGLVDYEYYLTKKDANGYNEYTVYPALNKAYGMEY